MVSSLFKVIFISTAISPVLLTIFAINAINDWEKINDSFWARIYLVFSDHFYFILIPLILTLLCWIIISCSQKKLESFRVSLKSVRISDREAFSFLLAYFLPLVTRPSLGVNMSMLYLFLVIFFVFIFASHSYHFNPLLGLFGYHSYEITTETGMSYILITRKGIRSCKDINRVVHITDYIVLEAGS